MSTSKKIYRQNKTDICCFCGDMLGLGPKVIFNGSRFYDPFKGNTVEVLACTECRHCLKNKLYVGLKGCAAALQTAYEPEFVKLLPSAEGKGVAAHRCFLLSGKMRNLGIAAIGERAVSIRNVRANFERAKIVMLTK